MNYKKLILDKLLDKYERSKHYYGDSSIQTRVLLKFNKKEFPQYELEDVEKKERVHGAVGELKRAGVVEFDWVKFEQGNILKSVWLVLTEVEKAYSLNQRKAKSEVVTETLSKFKKARDELSIHWMISFLDDSVLEIEANKKLPRSIPSDDELLKAILDTFHGLELKGEEEVLERIFSRKYLGGSKIFEKNVRSRLVKIVRDYYLKDDEVRTEDVLEEIGIIKSSVELLFIGPLKIDLNDKELDFTDFIYGSSMNSLMIKNFTLTELVIKRVLTVENKATYLDLVNKGVDKDSLVIYLGGFYSPIKRLFLEKIYDYCQNHDQEVLFYHWGDIDLGGFKIFKQLKDLIPKLQSLNMDQATLEEYRNFCDSFTDSYGKQLKKLIDQEGYQEFAEVIKYMLDEGIKLEQEAII
ncbi:MAG: hypothetical protein KAX49_14975 [Halanaerobiales bacterium]|nr:hypothetical protein [Halanaerobiales bacterium]